MKRALAAFALLLAPAAAAAQDGEPRFCPNRPDLGASGCTTEPGRVLVELSGIDWQRDEDDMTREDRILAGDLLIRTGIGLRTEFQLAWTPFGHVRARDKASGVAERAEGAGDIRVAIRQNLQNPDGKGLSFAIEPFVTLPVGKTPIGDGDWSAGAVIPIGYELADTLSLTFTGMLAGAVDEDQDGRHLMAQGILGLGYHLTGTLGAVAEISVTRDDDPQGASTEVATAMSLAWQFLPDRQVDVLAVAGLNRDTPDFRLVVGGAILF